MIRVPVLLGCILSMKSRAGSPLYEANTSGKETIGMLFSFAHFLCIPVRKPWEDMVFGWLGHRDIPDPHIPFLCERSKNHLCSALLACD